MAFRKCSSDIVTRSKERRNQGGYVASASRRKQRCWAISRLWSRTQLSSGRTRQTMNYRWAPVSSLPGFWFPFTACTPHRFLVATPSFDHGYQVPTTKGAGEYRLFVERGYRSLESRREDLERHTSQSRLCHRQRPSHHDQGMLPPLLR